MPANVIGKNESKTTKYKAIIFPAFNQYLSSPWYGIVGNSLYVGFSLLLASSSLVIFIGGGFIGTYVKSTFSDISDFHSYPSFSIYSFSSFARYINQRRNRSSLYLSSSANLALSSASYLNLSALAFSSAISLILSSRFQTSSDFIFLFLSWRTSGCFHI